MEPFSEAVIGVIKNIPKGKVATYGQIARLAGNRGAARQVSRILHTMSEKHQLPWHRIVNIKGKIVIKDPNRQKDLLAGEGVEVGDRMTVDLVKYQWSGGSSGTYMEWMEG